MTTLAPFDGYGYYNLSGNYVATITLQGITHNDSDGDSVIDLDERLTLFDDNAYVGSVTIGDEVYPVYDRPSGQLSVFYGGPAPSAPTSWPADLPNIAANAYCFGAGTSIQVSNAGAVTFVENLVPGDVITSNDGHDIQILWVGRQNISSRFGFAERLQPVRIKAGALGGNQPSDDLTVSNDHALFVDGILANAGALVNDVSIFRVPLDEFEDGTFTYYHIETEKHELILANNTPAETFIDNVSRQSFDNYQEYVDLYGEEREMDELPLPRAMSPRQLPKKIKARLAARAIELGYAEKAVA